MEEQEIIDLIFGLIYLGFFGLFFFINYLISSIGLYKIARNKNYTLSWISFLPVFKIYILSRLMNDKVRWIFKGRLHYYLTAPSIFFLCYIFPMFGTLLLGEFGALLFILMFLFLVLLMYVYWGIFFYVCFEFFRSYVGPKNDIIWFALTLLIGPIIPSIAFIVFNKNVIETDEVINLTKSDS